MESFKVIELYVSFVSSLMWLKLAVRNKLHGRFLNAVSVYIKRERERQREKERETETETDRQTEREKDRQTDRDINIYRYMSVFEGCL